MYNRNKTGVKIIKTCNRARNKRDTRKDRFCFYFGRGNTSNYNYFDYFNYYIREEKAEWV